ncbi:gfo/Idh/MocA family oxidoreductase [candidate division KSB1 bacterium]|nr:Gfo/Idh/MocA family oxidoreductase [candidate division KSB1 bacterium]RQW01351.1 MAG: gfo/Idh/MocA family oxidoreductase [candidate division KSB1 bacterium]
MFNLKTAIIGAGFMGPVHTEALKRLGVQVTGILGVDDAESQKARAALNIARAYKNISELLDDNIDVVHITTPNKLHYEMAKAALLAGKHVLCEKPLAMTSRESAELVELAKKSGRVAGVNYNIRFYPLNLEVKNRVQAGQLGEIYSVVGSYVQDWLLYPTDYNWRVLAEEGGALRAVADIGTHWLDLVQTITGLRVTAVNADLRTVHPVRKRPLGEVETFSGKVQKIEATQDVDITTEDCGTMMLKFNNDAIGNLWVSQTTAGRKNCLRYEIAGAQSAFYWNSEYPNNLWLGYRDKPNENLLRDPGLLDEAVRPFANYPGGHNEGFPDTFKQCFRAFYAYIQKGDMHDTPTFPTFSDGHHEIVLCEAILKSHREKSWVEIES